MRLLFTRLRVESHRLPGQRHEAQTDKVGYLNSLDPLQIDSHGPAIIPGEIGREILDFHHTLGNLDPALFGVEADVREIHFVQIDSHWVCFFLD